TKAPDGADYEERRYGLLQALNVAERQGRELGPIIASGGSYAENLAEVTDTDPDAIEVSSTSFVGLSVGSSFTTWSSDAPGYAIAGYYARRNPENLPTRLDGAATIPIRIQAHARFTGAGSNKGYIRFQ